MFWPIFGPPGGPLGPARGPKMGPGTLGIDLKSKKKIQKIGPEVSSIFSNFAKRSTSPDQVKACFCRSLHLSGAIKGGLAKGGQAY